MDDRIPKPKERYVILIAGMIVQLCAGIIYMWAVFKGPVEIGRASCRERV